MRIAMLSWESLHSIAVGGVAAHVSELGAALSARGHSVCVFTRRAAGQPFYSRVDGVHYYRCSYLGNADFVEEANNMCRSFVDHLFEVEDRFGPFDIVHSHDWLTANAMIWIKQGRARASVMTVHSTEYGRCGNNFYGGQCDRVRTQERAGIWWADRVIVVSRALGREIQWIYEAPEKKVFTIVNGVNPERFDVQSKPEARNGHQTVFFCGRLTAQKGPDLLVEAIPFVLKLHPSACFVVAGDGDMRQALEARVRELTVSGSTRFVGRRDPEQLVELYREADVVCVPSRNEPFGIVVLEAWCARKPVVVTDTGGPAEYVRHEINGLKTFPTSDSVAWGLRTALSQPELSRWMGENGRKFVETHFNWDDIARQTEEVYVPDAGGQFEMPSAQPGELSLAAPDDTTLENVEVGRWRSESKVGLESCTFRNVR